VENGFAEANCLLEGRVVEVDAEGKSRPHEVGFLLKGGDGEERSLKEVRIAEVCPFMKDGAGKDCFAFTLHTAEDGVCCARCAVKSSSLREVRHDECDFVIEVCAEVRIGFEDCAVKACLRSEFSAGEARFVFEFCDFEFGSMLEDCAVEIRFL